jgi:hypothetical protein
VPAERQEPGTGRLELAAALIASAVIGAPLIVALVARMLLPAGPGADTAAVAVFIGAFVLAVVAVLLVFHRLRSSTEDRQALRIPYLILALQIAIGAVGATVLLFTPR